MRSLPASKAAAVPAPGATGWRRRLIRFAVVGAVVGEFVGGQSGLGYLLLIANGNMDTALLFAGIVALTFLGVVFFALIGLVERLALPPHAAARASFVQESM